MKVRVEKYRGEQAMQAMQDFSSEVLFQQKEWWRAVSPKAEVLVAYRGDEALAIWPVHSSKAALGIKRIHAPQLTPYCGPVFKMEPHDLKSDSLRRKTVIALLESLGSADLVEFDLPFSYDDVLPFAEAKYDMQPRVTYRFQPGFDMSIVEKHMSKNLRRKVNALNAQATVERTSDIDAHLALCRATFSSKGMDMPFSDEVVHHIWKTCERDDSGILYQAVKDGRPIGSVLLVKDSRFVYYLMGGVSRDAGVQGIAPAMFWEGIQWAHKEGLGFDFEGSMVPSVESLFRGFSAQRHLYLRCTKTSSRYNMLKKLKGMVGR